MGGGSTFVSFNSSTSSWEPASGLIFDLLFPRYANERNPWVLFISPKLFFITLP